MLLTTEAVRDMLVGMGRQAGSDDARQWIASSAVCNNTSHNPAGLHAAHDRGSARHAGGYGPSSG